MSTVLEVTPEHIARLNSVELTTLLRRLLHLEAQRYGLPISGVTVPLKITVSDGGEDGRIEWSEGPASTDWIPCRGTSFQIKATELTPKQCADELADKKGRVKPLVRHCFMTNGAYVFFCGREYNPKQIKNRIDRATKSAKEILPKKIKRVRIEFYDATRIASWTNQYFAAAVYVLEECGHSLVAGLQTWEQWSGYAPYVNYQFTSDDILNSAIEQLRAFFIGNRTQRAARLVGLSGLGKTRLVL